MSNKYKGMTLNERLWISGLMDDYDNAISEKNISKVIEVIKLVELTDSNIIPILKYYGLNIK